MNARNRKKWYDFLVKRDGECCNITKVKGNSLTLIVDHVDGNDAHNPKDGSNYQLVSRRINLLKSAKIREQSPVCVCVGVEEGLQENKQMAVNSAEMARNIESEPAFREYIYLEMVAKGEREAAEFIPEAAEKARCSPETIRQRYLPKVCSAIGFYQMEKEPTGEGDKVRVVIRWRPQYRKHCLVFQAAKGVAKKGTEVKERSALKPVEKDPVDQP